MAAAGTSLANPRKVSCKRSLYGRDQEAVLECCKGSIPDGSEFVGEHPEIRVFPNLPGVFPTPLGVFPTGCSKLLVLWLQSVAYTVCFSHFGASCCSPCSNASLLGKTPGGLGKPPVGWEKPQGVGKPPVCALVEFVQKPSTGSEPRLHCQGLALPGAFRVHLLPGGLGHTSQSTYCQGFPHPL